MHNSCMTYYWCISSFLASTEVSVHLSETIVRGQVEVSARLQAGKFRLTALSGILQNGIKDSMLFHHPGEWFGCGIGAFSNMCWQLSWTRCMLSILGIHCSDLWDQSSKLIGCWWGSRSSVFKVCVVMKLIHMGLYRCYGAGTWNIICDVIYVGDTVVYMELF